MVLTSAEKTSLTRVGVHYAGIPFETRVDRITLVRMGWAWEEKWDWEEIEYRAMI
jgi:hypothetical protein